MRQFISQKDFSSDGTLLINGKDYRYLRQVLRVRSGDMLSVRTPDGILYETTVCTVNESEKSILVQVCDSLKKSSSITRGVSALEIAKEKLPYELWLFQFVAKPSKMEQIIQQAVECGVKTIVPVIGEFSQKQNVESLLHSKKERIERLIKESRQQSGSPVETEVLSPLPVKDAVKLWNGDAALVLWERSEETCSIKQLFSKEIMQNSKKIALAVGCEGGISMQEIAILKQAGFFAVHIAGNILRCETASLYGIAAVQSALGA